MTTTAPQSMDAEAIWRDLHGPLLGFIARRVPDPETAEDILQDVLHALVDGLGIAVALGQLTPDEAREAARAHLRGLSLGPRR